MALCVGLAMLIHLPHVCWTVIPIVARCMMPMQDRPGALFEYGHGAAFGVLATILIELAGPPDA